MWKTILKRLPRAVKMWWLVYRLMRKTPTVDRKLARHVATGYFKLALAWS